MFHHRHVLAVGPAFANDYGFVPVYSPIFVCDNQNEEITLRGNHVVPLLLGTDQLNFADLSLTVEFGMKNKRIISIVEQYKKSLLTAGEMRDALMVLADTFAMKQSVKGRFLRYLQNGVSRSDFYNLAGKTNVRFAGMSSFQQSPGHFVSQGLIEVHTCVSGVSRWRPYVGPGEPPLCKRYSCGDPVYAAPPGAYQRMKIGTVVDFLDENEARIRLEL